MAAAHTMQILAKVRYKTILFKSLCAYNSVKKCPVPSPAPTPASSRTLPYPDTVVGRGGHIRACMCIGVGFYGVRVTCNPPPIGNAALETSQRENQRTGLSWHALRKLPILP